MALRVDSGGPPGGIERLLGLIEEHPTELAYDFRHRFGLSFEEIGRSVTWKEAVFLTVILMRDPSSWLQAAHSGWKHPVSREWIVGSHTYDLLARVNSKNKPKPYPNPFPDSERVRSGKTNKTPAEVRKILEWMNPKET